MTDATETAEQHAEVPTPTHPEPGDDTSAQSLVLVAGDDDLVCIDDTCVPARRPE